MISILIGERVTVKLMKVGSSAEGGRNYYKNLENVVNENFIEEKR